MTSLPRLAAVLAGLSCCTPAWADQFNTTQGGGPSTGSVLQRRQGTSGNAAVPIDETNPLPVTAGAGGAVATKPGTFTPLGCLPWQAITTASAVSLSAFGGGGIPAGATLVDIVPSVTVVLRDDGSAPTTAGPGIPIQTNTIYPYSGNLSGVQFIAQTASGTIQTCFYK